MRRILAQPRTGSATARQERPFPNEHRGGDRADDDEHQRKPGNGPAAARLLDGEASRPAGPPGHQATPGIRCTNQTSPMTATPAATSPPVATASPAERRRRSTSSGKTTAMIAICT